MAMTPFLSRISGLFNFGSSKANEAAKQPKNVYFSETKRQPETLTKRRFHSARKRLKFGQPRAFGSGIKSQDSNQALFNSEDWLRDDKVPKDEIEVEQGDRDTRFDSNFDESKKSLKEKILKLIEEIDVITHEDYEMIKKRMKRRRDLTKSDPQASLKDVKKRKFDSPNKTDELDLSQYFGRLAKKRKKFRESFAIVGSSSVSTPARTSANRDVANRILETLNKITTPLDDFKRKRESVTPVNLLGTQSLKNKPKIPRSFQADVFPMVNNRTSISLLDTPKLEQLPSKKKYTGAFFKINSSRKRSKNVTFNESDGVLLAAKSEEKQVEEKKQFEMNPFEAAQAAQKRAEQAVKQYAPKIKVKKEKDSSKSGEIPEGFIRDFLFSYPSTDLASVRKASQILSTESVESESFDFRTPRMVRPQYTEFVVPVETSKQESQFSSKDLNVSVKKKNKSKIPTKIEGTAAAKPSLLFAKFLPKPGTWKCRVCLVNTNPVTSKFCLSCEAPRDETVPAVSSSEPDKAKALKNLVNGPQEPEQPKSSLFSLNNSQPKTTESPFTFGVGSEDKSQSKGNKPAFVFAQTEDKNNSNSKSAAVSNGVTAGIFGSGNGPFGGNEQKGTTLTDSDKHSAPAVQKDSSKNAPDNVIVSNPFGTTAEKLNTSGSIFSTNLTSENESSKTNPGSGFIFGSAKTEENEKKNEDKGVSGLFGKSTAVENPFKVEGSSASKPFSKPKSESIFGSSNNTTGSTSISNIFGAPKEEKKDLKEKNGFSFGSAKVDSTSKSASLFGSKDTTSLGKPDTSSNPFTSSSNPFGNATNEVKNPFQNPKTNDGPFGNSFGTNQATSNPFSNTSTTTNSTIFGSKKQNGFGTDTSTSSTNPFQTNGSLPFGKAQLGSNGNPFGGNNTSISSQNPFMSGGKNINFGQASNGQSSAFNIGSTSSGSRSFKRNSRRRKK